MKRLTLIALILVGCIPGVALSMTNSRVTLSASSMANFLTQPYQQALEENSLPIWSIKTQKHIQPSMHINDLNAWRYLSPEALNAVKTGNLQVIKDALTRGLSINALSKELVNSRTNLLLLAAGYGQTAIVEFLLNQGVNKDMTNALDKTALIYAAQFGNIEVIKLLISKKAHLNRQNKYGMTALMYAAQKGYIEIVQLLIGAGANLNIVHDRDTALTFAALNGHKDIVRLLIEARADAELGITCLALDGITEGVKILLNAGVKVNATDADGDTPLICAAMNGHIATVKSLIEQKATIDHKNKNGETALMWACEFGNAEIAQLLIKHGAHVNAQRKDGVTALRWAVKGGHADVVKILIATNAYVDLAVLNWAVSKDNLNVAKILVDHLGKQKVTINEIAIGKFTPLMWAARNGNKKMVKFLIENKADINAKDKEGDTALSMAAMYGHTEAAKYLIAAGAQVMNIHLQDPIGYAFDYKYPFTGKTLLAHLNEDEIVMQFSAATQRNQYDNIRAMLGMRKLQRAFVFPFLRNKEMEKTYPQSHAFVKNIITNAEPFFIAIKNGDLKSVEESLAELTDIHFYDVMDKTQWNNPLHCTLIQYKNILDEIEKQKKLQTQQRSKVTQKAAQTIEKLNAQKAAYKRIFTLLVRKNRELLDNDSKNRRLLDDDRKNRDLFDEPNENGITPRQLKKSLMQSPVNAPKDETATKNQASLLQMFKQEVQSKSAAPKKAAQRVTSTNVTSHSISNTSSAPVSAEEKVEAEAVQEPVHCNDPEEGAQWIAACHKGYTFANALVRRALVGGITLPGTSYILTAHACQRMLPKTQTDLLKQENPGYICPNGEEIADGRNISAKDIKAALEAGSPKITNNNTLEFSNNGISVVTDLHKPKIITVYYTDRRTNGSPVNTQL